MSLNRLARKAAIVTRRQSGIGLTTTEPGGGPLLRWFLWLDLEAVRRQAGENARHGHHLTVAGKPVSTFELVRGPSKYPSRSPLT